MKKHIYAICTSFISYCGLLICSKLIYNGLSFNILLASLYFVILFFYLKYDIKLDEKTKKYSMILSMIISIMLSLGSIVSIYVNEPAVNIFNFKNILYLIISSCGLYIILYKIFGIMFKKSKKINIIEYNPKMNIKVFLIMIVIIFLGHFLYFIRYYPAIMTPDSYYVIHYANNYIMSDFHPFGHTWFFGVFFHLGKVLFNDLNSAVAFATIIQMICMSTFFAYAIKFLYDKGLNKKICLVLLLFYALSPLHAHYSITLWRDIMFGGAFIILLISLMEFINCDKEKIIKKRYVLLFIVGSLILMFFRNNGIYIYLFTIPFIIIILKNKRKFFSVLTLSLVLFYFIIKGPVFDYLNVKKTKTVEAYSIPLQQIARVIASGNEIDDRDKLYLEKLFEYDKVDLNYKPYISDPIKTITNNDILTNEKKDFFKTYINIFFKYPNIYFDAYFLQTLGYWYPDIIYHSIGGESKGFFPGENIYSNSLTPNWYNELIKNTTSRNIPLSILIWSIGLQFIFLLISSFMLFYRNKNNYILTHIPLYGLWLSIMLATPVFCELRYVYGLFTCMPLIIVIPFLIDNNKKEVSKND